MVHNPGSRQAALAPARLKAGGPCPSPGGTLPWQELCSSPGGTLPWQELFSSPGGTLPWQELCSTKLLTGHAMVTLSESACRACAAAIDGSSDGALLFRHYRFLAPSISNPRALSFLYPHSHPHARSLVGLPPLSNNSLVFPPTSTLINLHILTGREIRTALRRSH